MDNRNYEIRAINSNLIKPKAFAAYKNAKDLAKMYKRCLLLWVDVIRGQESDKDILDVKSRIKNVCFSLFFNCISTFSSNLMTNPAF